MRNDTKRNPLPANPLEKFTKIYDILNQDRRWWGDATSLRFAAVTAVTCAGNETQIAQSIRQVANQIKEKTGWFGEMRTDLRFIISAMLVNGSDEVDAFLAEVERTKAMFRKAKIRRGGIYEVMAILLMRQQLERQKITLTEVERFRELYLEMKKHHWWLTGPDDFPACAMLVAQPGAAQEIGQGIEAIYQAIHNEGFSRGDPLQTAANILFLAKRPADEIAHKFTQLAEGFRTSGVSIWQSDYDELAILTFLAHEATLIVQKTLEFREKIKKLRPRPGRDMTFNLAASIAFLDLARLDKDLNAITSAKALMDMQTIINAQNAAAAAAAASVAASSAASSS